MVISDPQHTECSNLISHKQDERNIYVIMKTMCLCPPVHRVPKCMSCHKAIVVITGRAHCFYDYIYIYILYIYIYIYIYIWTHSLQTRYN